MKKIILFIICILSFSQFVCAQRKQKRKTPVQKTTQPSQNFGDTSRPKTVTVTSAFKPTLRPASKINFSAEAPPPDSTRPTLQYNVPEQNLFFSYQPSVLQPLAVSIDTSLHWENKNFIKVGYGNYTTPYLQAGFSLGDGEKSIINIHAKHVSSNGNSLSEKFSKTNLEAIGIFNPNENVEWSGKVFFDVNNQYQYGFQPDTLKFSSDDLRQRFTTFGASASLRNKTINNYGISYNPSISIDEFSDNKSGKETNFSLNAPLSKTFGEKFAFNLGLTANLTNYTSDSAGTINNNLIALTPSVEFKTPNVKLVAGFTPSWDNSNFALLPNFSAEAKLQDEKFILLAGWVGYYNRTTYESLASINPWLQQPKILLDTKITEQYAGFKGSAGTHVTYNAKASYLQFTNQPLFVNDTISAKSFEIVNESSMKDIRLHGEIGYTFSEKFSLHGGATINQYSNLKDNEKAWGLLPIELNGALRWNIFKDVLLKSDVFFWDGAQYRNKSLESQKLSPAVDLNAGVEFPILPKFNFWIQFNNILNDRYERWNQYPVLGFNAVVGVRYSFSQVANAITK
ncbi:MAG: hypothetical protein ACR2FN_00325 [Chitinophagaceae bacterium]